MVENERIEWCLAVELVSHFRIDDAQSDDPLNIRQRVLVLRRGRRVLQYDYRKFNSKRTSRLR